MEPTDIVIYQANPLVEGIKYNSLEENRLFLACLQRLVPHLPNSKYFDEEFKEHIIPAEELVELFGNDVYYDRLKEVSEKMLRKCIFIENKKTKRFDGYTVFSHIKFNPKEGGLIFKFNEDMIPWLLELYKIGYTRENLPEMFKLSSNYALRLLELLLQYRGYRGCAKDNIVHRSFSIEWLRKVLMVPENAYQKTNVFLPFVIKKPVAEINVKTRYKVTFKPIRTGRKTTDIEFYMILPEDDALPLNLSPFISEEQYGFHHSLEKLGVSDHVITGLLCSETREMLNFIEELAGRKDMTASKLIGGLKANGWIRKEFSKREIEKYQNEQQKKWRENLRGDITKGSLAIRK